MSACNRILLVEDKIDVLEAAQVTLELAGFEVTVAADGKNALDQVYPEWPGIIISDVKMPNYDGMQLLTAVTELDAELPVILVTGHGDIPMALEAIRQGAFDFVEKPVSPERLVGMATNALKSRCLIQENRRLRSQLTTTEPLESRIIGSSEPMVTLRQTIASLADVDVDVVVNGETGTGKELVARALHDLGHRSSGMFVALNCGGLPDSVIESELFGHERGAFTGAVQRRIGKLELASGGTLFLDEIESMPIPLQAKLLRVLQERSFARLGGNDNISIDLRVVSASKEDLIDAAEQGTFRDDLYYRLGVAKLDIVPLRSRLSDVPLLFTHFVDAEAKRLHRSPPAIAPEYLFSLSEMPWKGNVRELRNHAQRFVLGLESSSCRKPSECSLDDQLSEFERSVITTALTDHCGKVGETARALGIPRKRLYLRMRQLGLDKSKYRKPA